MENNELQYYNNIANWDFNNIKCKTEKLTNWDFYEQIAINTNYKSICLDLGTGGGEKVLKKYPNVQLIIGTDFSEGMVKTARLNLQQYPNKNVKFVLMDNLNMTFPHELFDLISARHTVINAKQIYNCLSDNGTLVIEGVDKNDCLEIKEMFGRGQGFNDEIAISQKDYNDLLDAGFTDIEKTEIIENEYYETKEDLLALLIKTPILYEFDNNENQRKIDLDILDKYINKYRSEKGILLKRRLYGIIARKN